MRNEATDVKATLTEIEDWLDRLMQLSEEVSTTQSWFRNSYLTQTSVMFTADQTVSTLLRTVILDALKVNMYFSVIKIYLNTMF